MTRLPTFYRIPPGTKPARCKSCGATVYWIVTARGANMPVSVDYPGCYGPIGPTGHPDEGVGVSHFTNCPNASAHSKKGGKRDAAPNP